MKKSHLLISCLLIAPLALSGCVTKRSPETKPLSSENSQTVRDEKGVFELQLPEGTEIVTDREEAGARLLRVEKTGETEDVPYMYIEQNPADMNLAIDALVGEPSATEISREPVNINGLEGFKVTIELDRLPGEHLDYHFLSDGNSTFVIFAFPGSEPWPYFDQVLNSFKLTGSANQATE